MTTWADLDQDEHGRRAIAIRNALDAAGWSLAAAAEILGVPVSTLHGMLSRYGLAEEYLVNRKRGRPRLTDEEIARRAIEKARKRRGEP